MTPRLRALIDQVSRSAEPDAVLVRKFADTRDPTAFAELVRRYGRLVWGQCRHLLQREADADDAFQATFFTLANSVRRLRDTNKLGPWLHGVAYRVCLNARRLAARRTKRERATAQSEATKPVADSAWDQAFAAVHDELSRLPDTLRVPFVLCVLEGKGTTEAAEQLGLKLGTFSARLSRAKQTLLDRLSVRGLTAGLAAVGVVTVGAATAPAAVASKACDLAAGGPVPANILSLSHGVLTMSVLNAKRWVVAAVLGCGLTAGFGGMWAANAQDKPKELPLDEKKKLLDDLKKKSEADDAKLRDYENLYRKQLDEAKKQLGKQLDKEKKDRVEPARLYERVKEGEKAPEFLYFGQGAGYSPTADDFEKTVHQVEAKGYTFVGVVTMKGQTKAKDNEAVPTLVFRRTPAKSVEKPVEKLLEKATEKRVDKDTGRLPEKVPATKQPEKLPGTAADEFKKAMLAQEKALQTEIDRLTKELLEMKKKEGKSDDGGVYLGTLADLGGDVNEAAELVHGLLKAKFGAKASLNVKVTGDSKKGVLVYDATKEQAAWLLDMVKQLKSGGSPKSSTSQPSK